MLFYKFSAKIRCCLFITYSSPYIPRPRVPAHPRVLTSSRSTSPKFPRPHVPEYPSPHVPVSPSPTSPSPCIPNPESYVPVPKSPSPRPTFKAGFHMIADDCGLQIADHKKFCDRLRSYGNTLLRSSAILRS